jgi:BirA family transcriptional regulator, biotin operon repressor / biotin---[acetyl-CoA-carboxylase] ligase
VTPEILRFDSIDSTNLEAIRLAKTGAREGLCVVAREQTHGRGRLDRRWHSPKDAGLYLSVLLRPSFEIAHWPLIALAGALAVSDAITKTSGLVVDIKWPNDICVDDQKLCGILAETVETPTGTAAIVGVGINLLKDSVPADLNDRATSIESLTGERVDPNMLADNVAHSVGERYQTLHSEDGREQVLREWCAHSSYAFDRVVRVVLGDDSFTGVTRGLEGDGALRVETNEGNMRIVRAGDVTALRALVSG